MFRSLRLLQRGRQQSPTEADEYGKLVMQSLEAVTLISTHFHKLFSDDSHEQIDTTSVCTLPLNDPINGCEVENTAKCLNNGQACGIDNFPAEMFK